MRPKIGQIVLIDPEDKLELRDKDSTIGTVLKVERGQSTVLVRMNPEEKKIVVPNKYLYPVEMNEKTTPYLIVERTQPRVRFTENDVRKLETVAELIEAMAQRLEYHLPRDQRNDMLDVASFAKTNVLYTMSKLKRLIAGGMEVEARDNFINRFARFAVYDEDARDIKDPKVVKENEKIAQDVVDRISKMGMSDEIGEYDEDTIFNSEILEWLKDAGTGNKERDKTIINLFKTKTTETVRGLHNNNYTKEELYKERVNALSGIQCRFRDIISPIEIILKSSTKEIINIPILILMDPTKLIKTLVEKYPSEYLTYQDFINAFNEAGSVSNLLSNERLDLTQMVDSVVMPIFPFEEVTAGSIMNLIKDMITTVCVKISEMTDIEILDDDSIEDVDLDEYFMLHLPIVITTMAIKPLDLKGEV